MSYRDISKQRANWSKHDKLKRQRYYTKLWQHCNPICTHCTSAYNPIILQFHHIHPEKKCFKISTGYKHSWESVLAEIEKCIILCPNCHAKLHAGLWGL